MLKNYTGVRVEIFSKEGELIKSLPPEGHAVLIKESQHIATINQIPMSSTLIIGASIPHQTNDTILIVPPTVALAFPERQDLWCTGELYKDHKGRNRGFIGLTKYNKSFETLGTNDIN